MKKQSKYYDGTRLLSMKDLNGKTPEIYICTSNRSAGKTTFFAKKAIDNFLNKGQKFMLVYRFDDELDDVSSKFFKDIKGIYFNDFYMRDERKAKGKYRELFIGEIDLEHPDEIDAGQSCGYAIALNNADRYKKYSHLFSDACCMIFDEFQSETNRYCAHEIQKLLSIHTSVARGNGSQVRYLPLYMISNPVSLINPYYVTLGIANRLKKDTKFLRGDGWVLEQGFNESASTAQQQSAFNRAFSNNSYVAYASQSIYLNDNMSFIEKPVGKSRYLATLKYDGQLYSLKEFQEQGIIYCDTKADANFYRKIALTTDDHDINYVTLKANEFFISTIRWYFDHGCVRFKNLKCKECLLTAISY